MDNRLDSYHVGNLDTDLALAVSCPPCLMIMNPVCSFGFLVIKRRYNTPNQTKALLGFIKTRKVSDKLSI